MYYKKQSHFRLAWSWSVSNWTHKYILQISSRSVDNWTNGGWITWFWPITEDDSHQSQAAQ